MKNSPPKKDTNPTDKKRQITEVEAVEPRNTNDDLKTELRALRLQVETLEEKIDALSARQLTEPRVGEQSVVTYNLLEVAQLEAARSSAQYFNAHMSAAKQFLRLGRFLRYCVDQTSHRNLFLEFGVFSGRSINIIAKETPDAEVYGFDSFEGLPERWREGFETGAFARTELPEVHPNVKLIKGWFDETLPEFASKLSSPVGFLHIDCDLYSSTKTIFRELGPHFADEVIIAFNEYLNYPGWEQHEFKAFQEFIHSSEFEYEYIACVPSHQQVAVRLNRQSPMS